MQRFGTLFVNSFDSMINDIVIPIFTERFAARNSSLAANSFDEYVKITRIKKLQDCIDYGPDCIVALTNVDILLNKLFAKFHILNKDFDPILKPLRLRHEHYYGTLVANMNFKLMDDVKSGYQPTSAYLQLQKDLSKLIQPILPTQYSCEGSD